MSCLRSIFFGLISLIVIKVTIASSEYGENDYSFGYVDKNGVGDDIGSKDNDRGKGVDSNKKGRDNGRNNDDRSQEGNDSGKDHDQSKGGDDIEDGGNNDDGSIAAVSARKFRQSTGSVLKSTREENCMPPCTMHSGPSR